MQRSSERERQLTPEEAAAQAALEAATEELGYVKKIKDWDAGLRVRARASWLLLAAAPAPREATGWGWTSRGWQSGWRWVGLVNRGALGP